jgi:anti-sigma B factor antagonist
MFNVDLSVGDFGGHPVVGLRGELDLADGPDVASRLAAIVAVRGPSVIVDLADLEFIDSSGLGVLVRALRRAREDGSDISLAAPQQQIHRILEVTGLVHVFPVYASVEQAANGTRPAPSLPTAAS